MVRVKRGKLKKKRKKKIIKQTKGYKWSRKSRYKLAKQALFKALSYQFKDRKRKKREARKLWQIKINAFVRKYGLSYSKFLNLLKRKKIKLNRKILADLTIKNPEVFEKIIEKVKS